jgi:predicted histidine transporter YuiF (NhaC family)
MKVRDYIVRALLFVVIAFEVAILTTEGIVPAGAYAAVLLGPIVIWKLARHQTIKEKIVRVLACIAFVYAVVVGFAFYKGYQTKVGHERAMEYLEKSWNER